ncbi:LytR/AlgR family response regulator transcription factor [Anditalea andensis]|uniref:Chemotaxis protein CheY n=1 Tax=Anditalea andensis TaxID=1048983 RepID=A0A074LPB4_9BACT|nr:LytTR family DNA-binding domain-containing protein [Anditalea andensis]KEO75757.1 chemotaxis protein CheY [Anditalea andensis]
MKIKCIAVDDEPLALDLVCRFIGQTSFLSLVGKFENAIEALGFLNKNEVHLVFLDIQMPDLSGMELARVLDAKNVSNKPKIIFTTAYNQFAIEGYKVDAIDYLLKPFSYEDFLKASTRSFQHINNIAPSNHHKPEDYIFLKVEYQLVKVMLKDITYVEAYKDYVKVYLLDKSNPILSLSSLKSMEDLLPADRFMRIHRSFIISLDHIDSISRNMVNIGNTQITISENHKETFMQFLSKWMG